MREGGRARGIAAVLLLLLLGVVGAMPAPAQEAAAGSFTASRACPAYQSRVKETNPGAVTTRPGMAYAVIEHSAVDGGWVRVIIPGARPGERWVAAACGSVRTASAPASAPAFGARAELAPFFDHHDGGPGDMTPPPPALTALDRKLLEVCGDWGSRPSQRSFAAALLALPQDLAAIRQAVGGAIHTPAADDVTFAFELAALWFAEDAFAHVFCGEPHDQTLGGLHFQGRFLQAQAAGWAGQMTRRACGRVEILPPVYTFGVVYKRRDGSLGEACPKGYGYGQDGRALLIAGTRAVLGSHAFQHPDARGFWQCLLPGQVGNGAKFVQQVYFRNGGLRSLFPDASPARGQVDCLSGQPWR